MTLETKEVPLRTAWLAYERDIQSGRFWNADLPGWTGIDQATLYELNKVLTSREPLLRGGTWRLYYRARVVKLDLPDPGMRVAHFRVVRQFKRDIESLEVNLQGERSKVRALKKQIKLLERYTGKTTTDAHLWDQKQKRSKGQPKKSKRPSR